MASGHPDAALYPLGMVADEVALVVERENRRIASEAIALKAAAAAILTQSGGTHFNELITSLTGEP